MIWIWQESHRQQMGLSLFFYSLPWSNFLKSFQYTRNRWVNIIFDHFVLLWLKGHLFVTSEAFISFCRKKCIFKKYNDSKSPTVLLTSGPSFTAPLSKMEFKGKIALRIIILSLSLFFIQQKFSFTNGNEISDEKSRHLWELKKNTLWTTLQWLFK